MLAWLACPAPGGDAIVHIYAGGPAHAVTAVVASVIGDPLVYVSGGAEHQGPSGGGPVAAIVRRGV
jgi:amidohydrolase ring-opening protein AtzD/TrzD